MMQIKRQIVIDEKNPSGVDWWLIWLLELGFILTGLFLILYWIILGYGLSGWFIAYMLAPLEYAGLVQIYKVIRFGDIIYKCNQVSNASQLWDVDTHRRTILNTAKRVAGAVFEVTEYDTFIKIVVKPAGIMHSDNVYNLAPRLTEAFGKTVIPKERITDGMVYEINLNNNHGRNLTNADFLHD